MHYAIDDPAAFCTAEELDGEPRGTNDWLWDGFLARGMISLCTSRWKAGKTTLLSVFIKKFAAGGELAGSAVKAGTTVVVSEEPRSVWAERQGRLRFGAGARFCCRPFRGLPNADEWQRLIDRLVGLRPDVCIFDPLAMFLPGNSENHSSGLLRILEPLHRLTDCGTAVLLLHHPRKSGPQAEFSPRGSGALTGFADILIELERPRQEPPTSRVRHLRVASRLRDAFKRTLQLNDDAADYTLLADGAETDLFASGWPVLKMVLEDASDRVTRAQILAQWPADYERPGGTTLHTWLERAVREGLVERTGKGRRSHPFRFALPGRTDFPVYPEFAPFEYVNPFIPLPKPEPRKKKDRI